LAGTESAYRALYQVTSADILAQATIWAGTHTVARDEIFNITNGDYFRWQHTWPRIAKMFDMEVADPVPTPLAVYMLDKSALWDRIVHKHQLQSIPYSEVASWTFGDFIFNSGFDNISSTVKARRAGFHDCIDTEEMFRTFFGSEGQGRSMRRNSAAISRHAAELVPAWQAAKQRCVCGRVLDAETRDRNECIQDIFDRQLIAAPGGRNQRQGAGGVSARAYNRRCCRDGNEGQSPREIERP
jgi:hypothetical protein